ncbi:gliding motility-associated C-terminal domain-containing protein [Gillisia sp. Hel1_33_143]|uniref:T9SS type B sorting domain-containing protein n=1 Tax=Gillisia sp. Hel1_33_143 TaxID=1336796 RepID=UPI00087B61C1|nr:T9SS type B sorting domain-containing protein [Gillisia sp. Hel1_33_143]SDS41464.1 gliding motility-associated C-terminal domain-containing protein [Gillisia sp. Hel1_33_143]
MKSILLTLFIFSIPMLCFSQKETAYWHFGQSAGLHFTDSGVESISNSSLQTSEGSASISDSYGNLLFYTDGTRVFDRTNEIMQNGSSLKGNASSTQSAIIVPRPGNPGRYYIFTVDKPDISEVPNDPIEGIHYSEIDMSMNNGKGAIISDKKNIHLITYDASKPIENEYKSSEKISAVIAGDCISYWVVTQFTNKFYAFRVSSAGVESSPVISTVYNNVNPLIDEDSKGNVTAPGYLKISPDGKKLAVAYSSTSLGSPRTGGGKKTGKVFLYNFDDISGTVSNELLILANSFPYGIEFSSESKKLYVTANNYDNRDVFQNSALIQFDLTRTDIANSQYSINTSNNVAGALQLALNGKIYRAGYPVFIEDHQSLSVINNPEATGANVSYAHNSIKIKSGYLRLGLPPFVQSLFNSNFDVENLCLGAKTKFTLSNTSSYDSLLWEFGDGSTSTEVSPTHTFTAPGSYTVSITKIVNGIPLDPACEEVIIVELPKVSDYKLNQCDVGDSDPTDGITTFNLQEIRNTEASNTQMQYYFYKTDAEAMNDINNEKSLDPIFTNTIRNQELTVKTIAFNTDCYSLSKVILETTSTIEIKPDPVFGCSITSGSGQFNFDTIQASILLDLNLGNDVTMDFFQSKDDAIYGINPLPRIYEGRPSTVFIKLKKSGDCFGFGSLELDLIAFPSIKNEQLIQACTDNFPLTIGMDDIPNPNNYNYRWNTGATTRELEINSGGLYTLEITDPLVGCGRTVQFTVNALEAPAISNIVVKNNGADNDITIETTSTDENALSYSLDNEYGPYQNSPVFNNVLGGTHTVFVKDENSCGVAQLEVELFGFPSLFTPNNDGYNDYWIPFNTDTADNTLTQIEIYDRYGKLLKQLSPKGKGWDGTFNGYAMPEDDYWFHAKMKNGEEFTGHFSLIR